MTRVLRSLPRYLHSGATAGRGKGGLKSLDTDSYYENPILELEKFVQEPLLLPEERWFSPSRGDMETAEKTFADRTGRGVFRAARAHTPANCPNLGFPEIAMLGFSNVGKSSLIGGLFHDTQLRVETSRRPGHTKTVDFFQVGQSFVLVDLPGYGLNQPASFAATAGSYLTKRLNLRCAFLLFNCDQGMKNEDIVVMKKLESLNIDYALIMTKIDLYTRSQKLKTLLELRRLRDTFSREHCHPQPFLVSSHTGEGLGFLQAFIASLLRS